jgi:hypothetical protein
MERPMGYETTILMKALRLWGTPAKAREPVRLTIRGGDREIKVMKAMEKNAVAPDR